MIVSYHTQALAEHEVEIPETINTQTLVKDLAKEIRLVEVNKTVTPSVCMFLLLNEGLWHQLKISFIFECVLPFVIVFWFTG